MKYFYSILLILIAGTAIPTFSMEEVANSAQQPKKLTFLIKTLKQIEEKYKNTNQDQYFADTQKVLTSLYTAMLTRDLFIELKKDYDICKNSEQFALYNGIYINGAHFHLYEKDLDSPAIETPLGSIIDYPNPHHNEKEYTFLTRTPQARAFIKKMHSIKPDDDSLLFANKHTSSPDESIKTLANDFVYLFTCQKVISQTMRIMIFDKTIDTENIKNYLSAYDLHSLFSVTSRLSRMAATAYNTATETFPSFIKQLQPLCSNNAIFESLKQENFAFRQLYKTTLEQLQNDLSDYTIQIYKGHPVPAQYKKLMQTLYKKYLTIAPELKELLGKYDIISELPGVEAIEIPQKVALQSKPQTSQPTKKKQRSRAPQNKKKAPSSPKQEESNRELKSPKKETQTITTTTTHQPIENREETQTTTTTTLPQPEESSPANTRDEIVIYDNRVLQQNINKKDPYHGFTLIAVPFILRDGIHKTWTNKKSRHADDLFEMYGEIEYHQTGHIQLVKFVLCKGADGAIYHIQMNKAKSIDDVDPENNRYNIEFPPLGTMVKAPKNSSSDDYGSSIIAETDYMVQINDAGLDATITLYK